MFSHTTIRHSYDFSHHIHEMAIEASKPGRDEDAMRETAHQKDSRQDSALVKFFRTLRETLYKN